MPELPPKPEYPRIDLAHTFAVLENDVMPERWRQLQKWGKQHLPDGTDVSRHDIEAAEFYRSCRQAMFDAGIGTWRNLLTEEVAEAYAESDPEALRTELVQVAAVCVAWIEDLDDRQFARVIQAERLQALKAEAELPEVSE